MCADAKVTRQREDESGAMASSVDRCNNRLWQLQQVLDQLIVQAAIDVDAIRIATASALTHSFDDVIASRKCAPRASKDEHAQRVIARCAFDDIQDLLDHPPGNGVEAIRAVQYEPPDAVTYAEDYVSRCAGPK